MKLTKQSVLDFLQGQHENGITAKQILKTLGLTKTKKSPLKKILRQLNAEKITQKRNHKYYLLEADKITTSSKKRPQRNNGELVGAFIVDGKERLIRSKGSGSPFSIVNPSFGAMHGDEVLFVVLGAKTSTNKKALIKSVLHRRNKILTGTFIQKQTSFFLPSNKNIPFQIDIIDDNTPLPPSGSKVLLEITRYPQKGIRPQGKINSVIASTSLKELEDTTPILKEYNIRTSFSEKTEKECDSFPQVVRQSSHLNRTDLRSLPFITIDGEDARDFDDAIYAQKEKNGFRLWVSIADVAQYVTKDNEIDKEAFKRSTSVYFPELVYPMLPEILSNGLCSLKEGVNRLTLTCEIFLNQSGERETVNIYESIIRVKRRLTYKVVDNYFSKEKIKTLDSSPELKNQLNLYRQIAAILYQKRKKKGVIDFSFPEIEFVFNPKKELIDIRKRFQTEANRLVEQFMLEANEAVGKFCLENELSILWRTHQAPSKEKLKALKVLLWNEGIEAKHVESKHDLNHILAQIQGKKNKEWLEYNILRTMSQARYEIQNSEHFGLASEHYCHFTSPIRRYPDLIVHRTLKNYLHHQPSLSVTYDVAEWTSTQERKAASAEKKATNLKRTLFIADRIGEVFQAKVSGINWNGLFVEIESPYVEGFVPLSSITDGYYLYDESKNILRSKQNKRLIRFGEKLEILFTRVDLQYKCPEFEWVGWLS